MNTAHPVAPEDLMAFLDCELSAPQADSVSAHLSQCADCADTLEQFRVTSEALSRWTVPVAPAGLEEAIQAEAARPTAGGNSSGPGKLPAASFRGPIWMLAGGLTVTVALVVSIGILAARRPAQLKIAQGPSPRFDQKYPILREPPNAEQGASSMLMLQQRMSASVAQRSLSDHSNEAFNPPAPMIARSVSLRIIVKDLDTSRSALEGIITRRHGYSAELTLSAPGGGSRTLQASLRVPARELAPTIAEFKVLGRTENEIQSGEEVTQKHQDLAERLKTARETENRFRAILQQRTGTLSDLLEVEERIARVRGEIEEMEAEQKGLEHRVEYATIDLVLSEEYKAALETPGDTFAVRSHNAMVTGYQNAIGTLVALLLFVEEYGPALLIWLTILGVPLYLLWRRYKRLHSAV